jgi:hypothetical protein
MNTVPIAPPARQFAANYMPTEAMSVLLPEL